MSPKTPGWLRIAAHAAFAFVVILLIFGSPLFVHYAYIRHIHRAVGTWCSSIPVGMSLEAMDSAAREKKWHASRRKNSRGDVDAFYASDGFFFQRSICKVDVRDSVSTEGRHHTSID